MNWLPYTLSYMTQYLFFYFYIESMSVIHLSSNQTVPNHGKVASALVILVTAL